MLTKTLTYRRPCAVALLAIAGTIACPAQTTRADGLSTMVVKTGLYVISGGGCNSVVRLSGNGLILVDGKLPGNYAALMKSLRRISEQPVRVLINTDYHENHTGNNAEFLKSGVAILAQANQAENALGKLPAPAKTFDDDITLKFGGIEAQALHFGSAHTSGDTVVYFPNLKAVAVGDLYSSTPQPDLSAGGNLAGWGPVLAEILKLDFDVVVPGTGPVISRAEFEAYKAKVDALIEAGSNPGME